MTVFKFSLNATDGPHHGLVMAAADDDFDGAIYAFLQPDHLGTGSGLLIAVGRVLETDGDAIVFGPYALFTEGEGRRTFDDDGSVNPRIGTITALFALYAATAWLNCPYKAGGTVWDPRTGQRLPTADEE